MVINRAAMAFRAVTSRFAQVTKLFARDTKPLASTPMVRMM